MDEDLSPCLSCLTKSAKRKSGDRLCIDCRIKVMALPEAEKPHLVKNAGSEVSSNEPDQRCRIYLLLMKSRSMKKSLELKKAINRPLDSANERKPFCENCKVRLKSWTRMGKDGWIVTSKYCQAPTCAKLEGDPPTSSKTTSNSVGLVADDATKSQPTKTVRKRKVPLMESRTYRNSKKAGEKQVALPPEVQQAGRQSPGLITRQRLAAERADRAVFGGAAATPYGSTNPQDQEKYEGTYENKASEATLKPEEGMVVAVHPPACSSISSGRTETIGTSLPVIEESQSVAVANKTFGPAPQATVYTQPRVDTVRLGSGLDVTLEQTCYIAPSPAATPGRAPPFFMAPNLHDAFQPTAATRYWDSPCPYSPSLSNSYRKYHPEYPFYPMQQPGATLRSCGPPQTFPSWSTSQMHSNTPVYTPSHGFYGPSPRLYEPLTSPQTGPGYTYQPEVQPPSPTLEPVFPSLNDPPPPPPPQPQYGYNHLSRTAYQSTQFAQNATAAWAAPTPNIY